MGYALLSIIFSGYVVSFWFRILMNSVSLSYSSSASVLTGPLISGLNLYRVGCLSAESDLLEAEF
jgi:hypothetical protein